MKIASPRVSVVVPMYNAAPWIGDTLESVFRQTYQHDVAVVYSPCEALVHRYSRFLDFLQEYDPTLFRDVARGIRRLGVRVPPGTTPMIQWLSWLIGYQNAMQLRSVYRMRPMLSGR